MSSEVELRNAATDLLSLLRDYMVVTSLTANDRFEEAVERLRIALSASPSIGRVTDSMVEAALRGWYPGWDTEDRPKATDGISRAKMRAALAAALVYHEEPAGDTQGAGDPVAWMTADGRIATDETKRTAMANPSRAAFNIPLYIHPAALVSPPDNGEPGNG